MIRKGFFILKEVWYHINTTRSSLFKLLSYSKQCKASSLFKLLPALPQHISLCIWLCLNHCEEEIYAAMCNAYFIFIFNKIKYYANMNLQRFLTIYLQEHQSDVQIIGIIPVSTSVCLETSTIHQICDFPTFYLVFNCSSTKGKTQHSWRHHQDFHLWRMPILHYLGQFMKRRKMRSTKTYV